MPDFNHLRQDKNLIVVADQPLPYVFEEIEGAPTIWSKPAIENNKPFFNETLRRSAAKRRAGPVTGDKIAASREEDKEILAHFCADSWNVKDANGREVEFSPENCLEFFQALPDFVFDAYRAWLTKPENFTAAAVEAATKLGKR